MKWLLLIVGALVVLVGVIALIGVLLPQSHVAVITRPYRASPEQVWRTITDVESFANWRPGLQSAERLPSAAGRERWREKTGHDSLTIEIVEAAAPRRLVTRIADEGLPFGGTWTYELKPEAEGTELTITEHGEVYNPIFRFISKFVMGHTGTLEKYHEGLSNRLSAASSPR
ncbi:MAG: SRPBCC family protein [Longimicrobiales bacterium]